MRSLWIFSLPIRERTAQVLARGRAVVRSAPGRAASVLGASVVAVVLVLAVGSAAGRSTRAHWLAPVAAGGNTPVAHSAAEASAPSGSPTRSPASPPGVATSRGPGPSRGQATSPGPGPSGGPAARPESGPGSTAQAQPESGRPVLGPAGSARLTGSSSVALTFDDGPDPVNTPRILDLLKQQGVKATFCLVGFRARDNPDLVRRIAAEGHTLCNHSWQHLTDLAKRPASYIRWDLTETNRAIHNAVPGAPISYFRAPGGNFSPTLSAIAAEYGMASIYWDVDPRDWDHATDSSAAAHVRRVVAEVEQQTRAGSIVLSHDNRQPDTIVAYETLLPWLRARFTLVALPTEGSQRTAAR